jgi:hypothetical protein
MPRPGVWQVIRVLSGFYENRYSLTDRKKVSKRVIALGKRLFDESGNVAFALASCEQSLVNPVNGRIGALVRQTLSLSSDVRKSFENADLDPIDLITNLRMAVSDRSRGGFVSRFASPTHSFRRHYTRSGARITRLGRLGRQHESAPEQHDPAIDLSRPRGPRSRVHFPGIQGVAILMSLNSWLGRGKLGLPTLGQNCL